MSSSLHLKLIAGIDTLKVQEGKIVDPRYHPTQTVGRLEDPDWQELIVPLPKRPARFEGKWSSSLREEDEWELARLASLYQQLTSPDAQKEVGRPAYEVLHWKQAKEHAHLLGFVVQSSPRLDLVGFALASIDEKYGVTGCCNLPIYHGRFKHVSSFIPAYLQRLQVERWSYPGFTDYMPGYYYAMQYLFEWIGFHLAPEEIDQVKLMLYWEWL